MKNTFNGEEAKELSVEQKSCYIREKLVENRTQTCREISPSRVWKRFILLFPTFLVWLKYYFIFLIETSRKKISTGAGEWNYIDFLILLSEKKLNAENLLVPILDQTRSVDLHYNARTVFFSKYNIIHLLN